VVVADAFFQHCYELVVYLKSNYLTAKKEEFTFGLDVFVIFCFLG